MARPANPIIPETPPNQTAGLFGTGLSRCNPYLELAATAAFLASEGERDPWHETARRKPEKAARLDDAKKLYQRLRAISLPVPLPEIP